MYKEYFGLKESPFSIAPDPRYLFMSDQHREALAHLVYGFNSDGGFVLLTGEVGTGKTTVCRCLLEQTPEKTSIAFILNPKLTVEELLATICDEFGILYPKDTRSVKVFVDLINSYLLDAHSNGRKAVLLIDEAQNLEPDVLEQLRLLTNLETNQKKLLQIILIGQPELREKLSKPELRQLSQRIIARYHLGPLSRKEVHDYVAHRLSVAGISETLFSDTAMSRIYRMSRGIPRLINLLCDRALLGAYTQNKVRVHPSTLSKAAREVMGETGTHGQGGLSRTTGWILSFIVLVLAGILAGSWFYKNEPGEAVSQGVTKPAVAAGEKIFDNLDWPGDMPISSSSGLAFQEIFQLWGAPYDKESALSPCEQARTYGLKCYEGLGSLNSLRNLNRPAVLRLWDNDGKDYLVALTLLKKDSAQFVVGGERREVLIDAVSPQWLGEYTLLWRPPAETDEVIKPGSQGPSVAWLDSQLSQYEGRTSEPRENILFDEALRNRVRKFQLARGLVPDGIVGAKTMIHLNSGASENAPVLTEKMEDN